MDDVDDNVLTEAMAKLIWPNKVMAVQLNQTMLRAPFSECAPALRRQGRRLQKLIGRHLMEAR